MLTISIDPLKVKHNVTKLDFIVPTISFLCINIDLNIQPISLKLYMTQVYYELYKEYKSWVPYKIMGCP